MPSSLWFRSAELRRAVAIVSVVLATGGLVLARTTTSDAHGLLAPAGAHEVRFEGPRARGSVALGQGKVLAGSTTRVLAEVRLRADEAAGRARAPVALAIVLDTSGSMEGEKLVEAKRAVRSLVERMHDDDQITFVRYDDRAVAEQSLASVRDVRSSLLMRLDGLRAGGGTNIPAGLEAALDGLRATHGGRGRRAPRMVLVSDGLDERRARAEAVADQAAEAGATVSSVGVGLEFDESYLGAVASHGHGNFGFANDEGTFASFLRRELDEATATAIEDARVTLALADGMRFVSAEGAVASARGDAVELRFGSLFAGDERRAVVELDVSPGRGAAPLEIRPVATWSADDGRVRVVADALSLLPSTDASEVAASRDAAVLASATSALASRRQLAAAAAFAKGDVDEATRLTLESERDLSTARASAPPAASAALGAQLEAYEDLRKTFARTAPSSAEGKAAAKTAAAREQSNTVRSTY